MSNRTLGKRIADRTLISTDVMNSWSTSKLLLDGLNIKGHVTVFHTFAAAAMHIIMRHRSSAMLLIANGDERVMKTAFDANVLFATEDVHPSQKYFLLWHKAPVGKSEIDSMTVAVDRHQTTHQVLDVTRQLPKLDAFTFQSNMTWIWEMKPLFGIDGVVVVEDPIMTSTQTPYPSDASLQTRAFVNYCLMHSDLFVCEWKRIQRQLGCLAKALTEHGYQVVLAGFNCVWTWTQQNGKKLVLLPDSTSLTAEETLKAVIAEGPMKSFEPLYNPFRMALEQTLWRCITSLAKAKIMCWPDGGTLLGILRHNGLIPWDRNANIGVHHDSLDEVERTLGNEFGPGIVNRAHDEHVMVVCPLALVHIHGYVLKKKHAVYNEIAPPVLVSPTHSSRMPCSFSNIWDDVDIMLDGKPLTWVIPREKDNAIPFNAHPEEIWVPHPTDTKKYERAQLTKMCINWNIPFVISGDYHEQYRQAVSRAADILEGISNKIVIFDFDETLVVSEKWRYLYRYMVHVEPMQNVPLMNSHAKDLLVKAMSKGNVVAIVSGRPNGHEYFIKQTLRYYNVPGYAHVRVHCTNGTSKQRVYGLLTTQLSLRIGVVFGDQMLDSLKGVPFLKFPSFYTFVM